MEWKVKAASEAEQVSLNLSHQDLHVLPDLVVEFPALESLDLSYNFLIGGVLSVSLQPLGVGMAVIGVVVFDGVGAVPTAPPPRPPTHNHSRLLLPPGTFPAAVRTDVFEKLGRAPRLTTLSLRCNYLSGALPEDMGTCTALTSLNLEGGMRTPLYCRCRAICYGGPSLRNESALGCLALSCSLSPSSNCAGRVLGRGVGVCVG